MSKEAKKDAGTAVATIAPAREITLADGQSFKVKKVVTAPLLQQKPGATVFVQFLAPFFLSKEAKGDGPKKEPPYIARVRNLLDANPHAEYDYIVPAVLRAEMEENFPNAVYVGAKFQVQKSPEPVAGKRYYAFSVIELE
jgi:hypothetical protein